MSGQDETMRLIAEVVDKFSGPLKDLNKAMGTINSAGKRMNAEGAKQTREHAKASSAISKCGNRTDWFYGIDDLGDLTSRAARLRDLHGNLGHRERSVRLLFS
jgi:hypothetical protein